MADAVIPPHEILDHVNDAVIVLDATQRVKVWNPAATHIYGWQREEVLDQVLSDVIPTLRYLDGSSREQVLAAFYVHGVWRGEVIQPHRDGTLLTIDASVRLLRHADGTPRTLVAINRDVTDRKLVEDERDRLYRETQEAVRIRHEFLAIAVHELRTPITAVLGYAQLLASTAAANSALSKRDQQRLRVITEQAERLDRLATKIFDLSRLERGTFSIERQPVDLCALIQREVEHTQSGADEHQLEYQYPDDALVVLGDALRLEQVVHNLLGNAIKYSPGGGVVTICLTRAGDEVVLAVRDPGIGIPAEAQPHLFERFYRAPNAQRQFTGMGIGLYLVNEIVSLHGGSLAMVSAVGEGSTFIVRLPLPGPSSSSSIGAGEPSATTL